MKTIDEEWQAFAGSLPGEPPDEYEQICFYTGYQVGYLAAQQALAERAGGMIEQVKALAVELGVKHPELEEAAARVAAERQGRLQ